ncbi:hypothetical protein ANN_10092 [Periplaneta americana]|uniref:Uncharacterized protein n=1 Tax=Periplaneta americana TaxID=6978 RepID=A0ABQ8TRT8_PERAM|nr:hypothetical protein ANN_10092 [Periplaneta americana]
MGESRNAYRMLVERPEGKRRRWEDDIKIDLRKVGYDDREWINLAKDRDRWRAYVRAAMNLRKINLRILNEAVEQVDSFKYLGYTISSNMSCSQEVKRRIAMPKEAFNRKRSIFCGFLEKELRKRPVKCFVWSVALYETERWTLRRSEEKRIEAFEM